MLFLPDGTEVQFGINQHSCVGIKKLICLAAVLFFFLFKKEEKVSFLLSVPVAG